MLPNLIVIGARKCGTTSLHAYLSCHPEVFMSAEKELRFFVAERNWKRGPEWYQSLFPVRAAVRGEASPCYSEFPIHDGVPERMARLIPDAKLVYLVRDPIDRLVSHYVMDYAHRYERIAFDAAVADLETSRFALYGRYWMQLERYLDRFSPEQIMVVDQDELRWRRDEAMARIFGFLGVDPGFRSDRFDVVHAMRRERRLRRPAAVFRRRLNEALGSRRREQLGRLVPRPLSLALSEPLDAPVVDGALRARLVEYYADDVARLRDFTGQEFASWSV